MACPSQSVSRTLNDSLPCDRSERASVLTVHQHLTVDELLLNSLAFARGSSS